MEDLKDLGKPLEFWEYFYEISKIPRCSGHEDQMRLFIQKEAEKLGYPTITDNIKNIIIKIPSRSKEQEVKVTLQSHMDMVCEKNDSVEHDFSKDPLNLEIIEINNEKWITAKGTTLGADNAVGIAYQLTLMKKIFKKELNLEPIAFNLLFTVDEERGMTGASQIDKSFIDTPYLINLDSEEDDRFTVGCAGGRVFDVNLNLKKQPITNKKAYTALKFSVGGLLGGHSGVDINKGRANALKLLSQILWRSSKEYELLLSMINGGNLDNVIPREAESIFFIKKKEISEVIKFINREFSYVKSLFDGIESDIEIKIEEIKNSNDISVISSEIQKKLLNLLMSIPNGVILMHPTIKKLIHTSTNLASIVTEKNLLKFVISQRSLTQYDLDFIFDKFNILFEMSNLPLKINIKYEYPSWTPNFKSKISELSRQIYYDLFKKDVTIQAIHGGLECAYFSHHDPDMEIISIGPDMVDVHSPDERLKIKSVEKLWYFLLALLKKLV